MPDVSHPDDSPPRRVLVTDFDGTITRRDFYQAFVDRLMPGDAPDFWQDFRAGRITHFDALASIFAHVSTDEATLLGLIDTLDIEPRLAEGVQLLRRSGWGVVVVSAGCRWYIDRMLEAAGVDLEVHGNPGSIDAQGRLRMTRACDAPHYCHEVGVDKPGAVRARQASGITVAYAGDGPLDVEPALLAPPELRFARKELAELLRGRGEGFRPFERWIEVAEALAAMPDAFAAGGP